jgi:hypothetical protein
MNISRIVGASSSPHGHHRCFSRLFGAIEDAGASRESRKQVLGRDKRRTSLMASHNTLV